MLQRGPIVIPAIDLLDGQVVRLRKGSYDQVTSYQVDPIEAAEAYRAEGASWLHVIDQSAARDGSRPAAHGRIIARLAELPGLSLQVGGGVRSREDCERLLGLGVNR